MKKINNIIKIFGQLTSTFLLLAMIPANNLVQAQSVTQIDLKVKAFEMENIGHTFLNMDAYFPIKELKKSKKPFVFYRLNNTKLPEDFQYADVIFDTEKYIDSSFTQGLLVIQNDVLVYENYWRGQKEDSRHISWSTAKSFISALLGIAIEEGLITNLNQPIDEYLPELKGSGYEGVPIKDILQMSSGVKFDETYGDPNSDISKWFESFILGKSQDKFAATLINERKPGTYNHYVSINTHVLGMLLVKVTGKSITDYMTEKIWHPIGAEFDSYWMVDNEGMEMALGGLNACLRDYAKLGQLFLHKGNWQGQQIVPADWIEASTHADAEHLEAKSKNSAHAGIGYGYQWWVPYGDEGEFMAVGVFNQFIYVNPTTNTVIVKNSANENFYDTTNLYANKLVHLELFRKIAHNR